LFQARFLRRRHNPNGCARSSIAETDAGYGPPSKTGNSAVDPPGPSTASTCSRPNGEDLKIRTRPKATMYKPAHGSPSEKSISPGPQDRMAVREASAFNSRSVSVENKEALRRISIGGGSCMKNPARRRTTGAGRSDLSDREIIDALKAMREERIHKTGAVAQEESDVLSNLRMPLNYQDETRSH
jgi:hypothetical protein